jgi:hypothetical protein
MTKNHAVQIPYVRNLKDLHGLVNYWNYGDSGWNRTSDPQLRRTILVFFGGIIKPLNLHDLSVSIDTYAFQIYTANASKTQQQSKVTCTKSVQKTQYCRGHLD